MISSHDLWPKTTPEPRRSIEQDPGFYDINGRHGWVQPPSHPTVSSWQSVKLRYAPHLVNRQTTANLYQHPAKHTPMNEPLWPTDTNLGVHANASQYANAGIHPNAAQNVNDANAAPDADASPDARVPAKAAPDTPTPDAGGCAAPRALTAMEQEFYNHPLITGTTLAWTDEQPQSVSEKNTPTNDAERQPHDEPSKIQEPVIAERPRDEPSKLQEPVIAALESVVATLSTTRQSLEVLQDQLPKQVVAAVREFADGIARQDVNRDQRFDDLVQKLMDLTTEGFSDLKVSLTKNDSTLQSCVDKLERADERRGECVSATESGWKSIRAHLDRQSEPKTSLSSVESDVKTAAHADTSGGTSEKTSGSSIVSRSISLSTDTSGTSSSPSDSPTIADAAWYKRRDIETD
jgi:hypothetical protein